MNIRKFYETYGNIEGVQDIKSYPTRYSTHNKRNIILFENFIDDYLDAINSGDHVYWDEKSGEFIGKSLGLERVRKMDDVNKKILNTAPYVIFFKDRDLTLIPTYVDGDNIDGCAFRDNDGNLDYAYWSANKNIIKYKQWMKDTINPVLNDILLQLPDSTGKPYIEGEYDFDEIDNSRIDQIMNFLISKPNKFVSYFAKKYGLKYGSISDISHEVISKNLWDRVKLEL